MQHQRVKAHKAASHPPSLAKQKALKVTRADAGLAVAGPLRWKGRGKNIFPYRKPLPDRPPYTSPRGKAGVTFGLLKHTLRSGLQTPTTRGQLTSFFQILFVRTESRCHQFLSWVPAACCLRGSEGPDPLRLSLVH